MSPTDADGEEKDHYGHSSLSSSSSAKMNTSAGANQGLSAAADTSNMNLDGPSDTRSQRSSPGGRSQTGGSQAGGSQAGGARAPSQSGSPARSRSGSTTQPPKAPSGFPAPLGYDPGRDPTKIAKESINRRIDLPPEAYSKGKTHPFAHRPGFNKSAQDINIAVNQFRVMRASTVDVYQYDVSVTPDMGRPVIVKKIWYCGTMEQWRMKTKKKWLFDDRKLAWSAHKLNEAVNIPINLDKEMGRKQIRDQGAQFYISLRLAKVVRLDSLRQYLEEKMEWDNSVLEGMNFFDHVLRQGASDRMMAIKRLFFSPDAKPFALDACINVYKGCYASVRLNQSIAEGGSGLGINVDVSNTAFWSAIPVHDLMIQFVAAWEKKYTNIDYVRLGDWLKPVPKKDREGKTVYEMSECFKILRRLHKLHFNVFHRHKTQDVKDYTLMKFAFDQKYGADGGHTKMVKFVHSKTGLERSVFDHYLKEYNIYLKHPQLPCIVSSRGGFFPPEACNIKEWQRYNFKLDPNQTSNMIKFAVTRPNVRSKDIMWNVSELAWDQDPYLKEFGIQVRPTMAKIKAKLIKNPEITYGNGKVNPGVTGRWDLRGKKFVLPNMLPLKSWSFVIVDSCIDKPSLETFIKTFKQVYQGHGGRIEKDPIVTGFSPNTPQNKTVEDAYQQTGRHFQMTPQIIFFILKDKTQWIYERLKKSMDCRFAVVSQMLNVSHVRKNQPQYHSNVCMKVNSKLGGQTSRIAGAGSGPAFFKSPTMIIGADLSHASPGTAQASMAAVTCSQDKDAAVYYAACETNGYRTEIIIPLNMCSMLPGLVKSWLKRNSPALPQHIFYFRDGVSEGEFAQVMDYEVSEIRKIVKKLSNVDPKITVIIATKRHHIRFFPEKGDKNANPLPGTLVEREVTHPFHYDFYLCSHVAIQGTARPVHYHVIHDEVKMPVDELQRMIYQQCYQYARSTTPVSLHPAVYYAHIASSRARSHENAPSSEKLPESEKGGRDPRVIYKDPNPYEESTLKKGQDCMPLIPMGGNDARPEAKETIRHTMWYI